MNYWKWAIVLIIWLGKEMAWNYGVSKKFWYYFDGGLLSIIMSLILCIIYLRKKTNHAYNTQSSLLYPFPRYKSKNFPSNPMPITLSLTQKTQWLLISLKWPYSNFLSQIKGSVVVLRDQIHREREHTIYYKNQD